MNAPTTASRTPFIIILILLLAITGVQYFFNFNGLNASAAMDQAQIARNVARGQGMATNWLRPIQMVSGSTRAGLNPFLSDAQIREQETILAGQGESLVNPEKFNPYALRDTRNAPLNILVEAAVFKVAGVHKFDLWSMTGSSMIYLPDRIVAGISCMFFILAVLSCYYILHQMFDVTIASFTCLTMILSNLFLQYATSGLPQMMMLFFFAWGIHFLSTALQNREEKRKFLMPLIYSSICFSCVCLTGWIGLWPMAGFLIFVGIRFKPHGLYCIPGLVILFLLLAYPVYINRSLSGGFFGTAYYTSFTGLTGNEEIAMNSLAAGDIPIAAQKAVTSIVNNILTQGDLLYENLGNLPLAMVFLLALLHKFRRPEVNQAKWGVFAMWVPAVIGMALYTSNKSGISLGQIQILHGLRHGLRPQPDRTALQQGGSPHPAGRRPAARPAHHFPPPSAQPSPDGAGGHPDGQPRHSCMAPLFPPGPQPGPSRPDVGKGFHPHGPAVRRRLVRRQESHRTPQNGGAIHGAGTHSEIPRRQGGQHPGDSLIHAQRGPPHHCRLLRGIHPPRSGRHRPASDEGQESRIPL